MSEPLKQSVDTTRRSGDAERAAERRVVDAFEAAIPEVAARAARAMADEIPAYSAAADGDFHAEVRDHAVANYTAMAGALRDRRSVLPDELVFLRAPTTRRARAGFPLPAFLHAFRVGQRVAWEAVRELAGPDDQDAALALVGPLLEYINIASTEIASIYVEAEELLLLGGERVRRDAIEELLSGRLPEDGPRREAVREAGLLDATALLVISAEATTEPHDEHELRSIASALGRAAGHAESPLVVLRGDEIVAIAPVTSERADRLREALQRVHARAAARNIPLALGTSTLVDGPQDLPDAYREALQARGLSSAAGEAVCLWQIDPLDYLTLGANATAARLVPDDVARFVRDDLAARGMLTATLEAYAAANLSPTAAAAVLHCHVNTVHNRLARIAQATGRDPRSFADVSELLVARRLIERTM